MALTVEWRGPLPPALKAAVERTGARLATPGDVVVLHQRGEPETGVDGRPWVWVSPAALPVAAAVRAAQRGAYDAFGMPAAPRATVGLERLVARLKELAEPKPHVEPPPGFVAQSDAARKLLVQLSRAAATSMPVLLTGETGTGKELAARLIHELSARAKKQFVPINCAAIPNELMESELFGYTKGSFSGATRDYDGQLMAAEGGTVFLDEIDDTPISLQLKLLRVLEDRVVSRLGENAWRKVNFRILAATNRDLRPLIASGAFGADVYERLSTVAIELPPLRARLDDLPLLTQLLLQRFYAEEQQHRRARVVSVTDEAMEVLRQYPWPGNVRELRNVVFGALVNKASGTELLASDLPRRLWSTADGAPATTMHGAIDAAEVSRRVRGGSFNLRLEREQLERVALTAALESTGWNAAAAAERLGEVGRGAAKNPGGTVRVMMQRLGVRSPRGPTGRGAQKL